MTNPNQGAAVAASSVKPRKGSLAAFEERFRLELAAALRSGIDHPVLVAMLAANAATKRQAKTRRKAPKEVSEKDLP